MIQRFFIVVVFSLPCKLMAQATLSQTHFMSLIHLVSMRLLALPIYGKNVVQT